MSALPTLITEAETKAAAMKAAVDDLVGWLNTVRTDIAQCEADLAGKRRAADTETARLRAQIEERRKELADAERELAQVRKQVEREKHEIGMERQRLLKTVDEVLAR
jgi:chromosome segregation ATPase